MSYKDAKEAFVSHTTGSTLGLVLRISSITVASLTVFFALKTRFSPSTVAFKHPLTQFFIETFVLSAPILFGLTTAADRPLTLTCGLLAVAFFVTYFPRYTIKAGPTSPLPTPPPPQSISGPIAIQIPSLPSLTVYRANMMLLTAICILAVDFPAFPRSLAKCESWGISIMDLGVGSFVFSQGLVSAIPYLKSPSYASAPVSEKLIATVWKVFPILLLGLVRVMLVKGTDYPEHVSEYGVHWNFFITLALLPLASVLLHPYMAMMPIPLLGLLITLGHQFLLSNSPLQDWALSDERVGLIGMNKEGITSFPGYLAIHILGFGIGTLVLPPSPSHFRRAQKQVHKTSKSGPYASSPSSNPTYLSEKGPPLLAERQLDKTVIELCAYAVVWWSLYLVAQGIGGGRKSVSRRLANTAYVLLTTAYNSMFLLCFMLIELVFSPATHTTSRQPKQKFEDASVDDEPRSPDAESAGHGDFLPSLSEKNVQPPLQAPALFEAINRNGLPVFLAANVTTGLVNMTFKTMYMSDGPAMMLLVTYVTGVCGMAWIFRRRRLLSL